MNATGPSFNGYTYTVTGLTSGQDYEFAYSISNALGTSEMSQPFKFAPGVYPTVIGNISVTAALPTIIVSW